MKKIFLFPFVVLCALVLGLTGCSSNDDNIPAGMAEMSVKFYKHTKYEVTSLSDVASISMKLEKEGKEYIINQPMIGDDELITTQSFYFGIGTYTVKSYTLYNKQANVLTEMDVTSDNEWTVSQDKANDFEMPFGIRKIFVTSSLRNTLFGICEEIFGPDSTYWPSTWRKENEDIADWENLQFETDDYDNVTSVCGIYFNSNFTKNARAKGWTGKMTTIPDCISNLVTITSIVVEDQELETLPASLKNSNIISLVLKNTKLKEIPAELMQSRYLSMITIINSDITTIPDEISNLADNMTYLEIRDCPLASLPEGITKLSNLNGLTISGTQLSSLPEDIFKGMFRVSRFDFSNNKRLSSLPTQVYAERSDMRGLILDGSAFAEIPPIALNNTKLKTLSMKNTLLTSVPAEIENMNELHTLVLDGCKLTLFPNVTMPNLLMLSLIDTGLTSKDIETSGLTNLSRVFFTQSEKDKYWETNTFE